MDSVAIYCNKSQVAGLMERIPPDLEVEVTKHYLAILRRGEQVLYVERMERLREEIGLDEQEIEFINSAIHDPIGIVISFHDPEFCKEVVMAMANREDVLVDNAFGVMRRGHDMTRLMKTRPGLDWRNDGLSQ